MEDTRISKILLLGDYVSQEDLEKVGSIAKAQNISIIDELLSEGLITKDLIGQAIAESFGISYADLNSNEPDDELLSLLSANIAREFNIIPYSRENDDLIITTDKPVQEGLEIALKELFPQLNIKMAYSLSEDVDKMMLFYQTSLETRFQEIIENEGSIASEMLDEVFNDAISLHTSDIHFEPREGLVVIRFRIDGMLREVGRIPSLFYENIVNRIKVQSRLRIDEHFSTQDGAIRYSRDGKGVVDMRVSIAPILNGEKITIRLLSQYVRNFTLSHLGLSQKNQDLIIKAGH